MLEPEISGRKTYSYRAPQRVPKGANPRDNSRSHSRQGRCRYRTSYRAPTDHQLYTGGGGGGGGDSQYQSKKQWRGMLQAASVRARVNTINDRGNIAAVLLMDDPISFPPINPTSVITPHYDALALTVCINSFDVHRVLVDPSSTTDLLHLPAFNQMRVPIDHLHFAGRVLSGFNGATTLSVGDITFLVKAGLVTQQVLFTMVKDLGPYNAILGRAWLQAMNAVPSMYHQTVSYLTESRQVDLQGSQLAVRQCYQLSLQGREKSKCPGEPPLKDQPQ